MYPEFQIFLKLLSLPSGYPSSSLQSWLRAEIRVYSGTPGSGNGQKGSFLGTRRRAVWDCLSRHGASGWH